MTKTEVKNYIKKWNDRCRIVDWDWGLWKTRKIVVIIMVSKNHVVYRASYYLYDGAIKTVPDSIECL